MARFGVKRALVLGMLAAAGIWVANSWAGDALDEEIPVIMMTPAPEKKAVFVPEQKEQEPSDSVLDAGIARPADPAAEAPLMTPVKVGPTETSVRYVIDPSQTEVLGWVQDGRFVRRPIRFRKVTGFFLLDMANLEKVMVDAVVHTGSIDTGSKEMDALACSAAVLDCEHYPEARFVNEETRIHINHGAELVGHLTLKGKAQHVSFHVKPNEVDVAKDGRKAASFQVRGLVQMAVSGVVPPETALGPISNEVEMVMQVVGYAE